MSRGLPSFTQGWACQARSDGTSSPQPNCVPRAVCVRLEHWLPGCCSLALSGSPDPGLLLMNGICYDE